MQKIGQYIDKVRGFIVEVRTEAHKSAWPSREELVQHTMVVIVFMLILGVYIGISDGVLLNVVRFLIRRG